MMSRHKVRTAGWILSFLLCAFLVGPSAIGKFVEWEGKTEMFDHFGYTQSLITKIGIVEVIIAVLFVIPRTGFIAAILLTGYLGGALGTHLRVGDSIVFPIVIGVLVWIALGLRQPIVFSLAIGSNCQAKESLTQQLH